MAHGNGAGGERLMSAVSVEGTGTEWQAQATAPAVQVEQEPRDEAWFAALYDQSFDTVYHLARTLVRDHDVAEGIVAETYVRAWRSRLHFGGRGSPLWGVMANPHNCAMDYSRARRPDISLDLVESIADRPEPGASICEADAEAICRAITKLTPEQQQVIFLRLYHELPHEAVAAKLGKSPTAIRQIQFRALVRLRNFLREERSAGPAAIA
jgi:RNA polymerase sigma-70 factor (ECF subfamily)